MYFESATVKSYCPMQENYEIFKDLIQTICLLYEFYCSVLFFSSPP